MLKPSTRLFSLRSLLLSLILPFFIQISYAQQVQSYPKIVGYFSFFSPVGTLTNGKFTDNFSNSYSVSFPFGMNILKSDKFGVSFEVTPTIRTENNIAKVSSVTFHPGAMFRFKHGFTFIQRLAFESNGRFGTTTIFNKLLIKGKDANLFTAIPFPVRFGNNAPVSITTGLQLGVSF